MWPWKRVSECAAALCRILGIGEWIRGDSEDGIWNLPTKLSIGLGLLLAIPQRDD